MQTATLSGRGAMVACLCTLLLAPVRPSPVYGQNDDQAAAAAGGVPQWLLDHMEFLTRDGGRWITDNSAHQSAQEPADAYGIQWEWGIGRTSVRGRLFGLVDGTERGTFWEFRLYWHPGERRAVGSQFGGGGTLGIGPMWQVAANVIESDQTFYNPDGTSLRVRHVTIEGDDQQETRSFDFVDGQWQARRTYVWYRSTE